MTAEFDSVESTGAAYMERIGARALREILDEELSDLRERGPSTNQIGRRSAAGTDSPNAV